MTWAAGMYWSYAAPAWCGLVQMYDDGTAMVRHEFTWRQRTEQQASDELAAFLKKRKIELVALVAQPAIFPKPKQSGQSISEVWQQGPWPLYKGHDDLAAGWQRLHSWLNDDERPAQLVIHASCVRLIKTLPILVASKSHPDDLDIHPDVYPAWGLANWAMSRPTPGTLPEPEIGKDCLYWEIDEIRRENAAVLRY